ncbi:MAG TPA: S8 family serine peptidase [Solirubrobacteraceae bacterium]
MRTSSPTRLLLAAGLALAAVLAGGLAEANVARAAEYVRDEVVVGYRSGSSVATTADAVRRMGVREVSGGAPAANTAVLKLPRGESVAWAIARLRRERGIAYAVPNYVAHIADAGWFPNDPGDTHHRRGWESLQWNFLDGAGVDAPQAWANLIADHRPGGKGVVVGVLDTGVAYRKWNQFRPSPDFDRTKFVAPHDFIAHNGFPLDREGHGTFVAGTIAESTNNGRGATGLAYGASIMPIRVLDRFGTGDASTIARGVRYAVTHHAQVINLSLEFTPDVTAADIPDLLGAIQFATKRGVTVVAASGNEGLDQVAYPARAPSAIAVGATTKDRCVAEYSNGGPDLALVAPGGGDDSTTVSDADCHPGRPLPPIHQMTFFDPRRPTHFGFPGGVFGTSMSAPHVSATVALVIASGVLGRHPTPDQIRARLEQTATPLGSGQPNPQYGYGLLNAGAATRHETATTGGQQ